jgi:hypothetical protein
MKFKENHSSDLKIEMGGGATHKQYDDPRSLHFYFLEDKYKEKMVPYRRFKITDYCCWFSICGCT